MASRSVTDRLVLSPQEPLVAGGPAEAFESQLRQLYRNGQRHLVIDFRRVPAIDSAGIRALVRGHTTAQRVEGTLRLAALQPRVRETLDASRLANVFDIYDSTEAARIASWPWRTIRITMSGAVLCGTLVWLGLRWPNELAGISPIAEEAIGGAKNAPPIPVHPFQPFIELGKLVVAALIGLQITAIHQPAGRER